MVKSAHGKLVHVTGDSQCNEPLSDRLADITMNGVIKIKRQVEVREYREHGSNKNKSYDLRWVSTNNPTPGGGYSNDPAYWFINSE